MYFEFIKKEKRTVQSQPFSYERNIYFVKFNTFGIILYPSYNMGIPSTETVEIKSGQIVEIWEDKKWIFIPHCGSFDLKSLWERHGPDGSYNKESKERGECSCCWCEKEKNPPDDPFYSVHKDREHLKQINAHKKMHDNNIKHSHKKNGEIVIE